MKFLVGWSSLVLSVSIQLREDHSQQQLQAQANPAFLSQESCQDFLGSTNDAWLNSNSFLECRGEERVETLRLMASGYDTACHRSWRDGTKHQMANDGGVDDGICPGDQTRDFTCILGLEPAIDDKCQTGGDGTCCKDGYNRLRFGNMAWNKETHQFEENRGEKMGWSACENMYWLFCGAIGKLPHQQTSANGGEFYIVSPPAKLGWQYKPECITTTPTLDSLSSNCAAGITIHEMCWLSGFCTNSDEMFANTDTIDFKCQERDNWQSVLPTMLASDPDHASWVWS